MKTNLFAVFAILVMSVMIIGASGCQKTQTVTNTAGLEMSFVKDAPPVSVVVGQEFPIRVDILNKGGEFVNKGQAKFYLSGLGQNFVNVKSSLTNDKTLTKESIFPETLIFADKAKFTFPIQDLAIVPIVLTSCYDYSGRAQGTLCILKNNESKVCKISGEKLTSNTAGPVQIGSITETLTRSNLIISFDIVNKGKGTIYLADTVCDKLEINDFVESAKQDKLNVKVITNDDFNCMLLSSSGQIEGLEGIVPLGKVICEKPLPTKDYTSVISIELRYKYRDSISQTINIQPAA
jgi:hypothetical protein